MSSPPVLVVGGGMAGFSLVVALEELGIPADLAESHPGRSSALASGGILNPMPGRFLDAGPEYQDFVQARDFLIRSQKIFPDRKATLKELPSVDPRAHKKKLQPHTSLEPNFELGYFYPKPIFRPFLDERHRNRTLERIKNLQQNLYRVLDRSPKPMAQTFALGGVLVDGGGYFQWESALLAMYHHLQAGGRFYPGTIHPKDLRFGQKEVAAGPGVYQLVILATGAWNCQKWSLPLRPMGGQSLEVANPCPAEELPIILAGKYLIPTHRDTWVLGATQEKHPNATGPSSDSSNELLSIPEKFLGTPAGAILHRRWGIRPVGPDRKAFFRGFDGSNRIAIFNGLGSKGGLTAGLLAPALARKIAQRLQSGFHPGDFF